MATHSSILAWEIPRTEEPGGLQSMGYYNYKIKMRGYYGKANYLQQTLEASC